MSGGMTGYVPAVDPFLLPPSDFEALIAQVGQRAAWMKSHTCPCIFGAPAASLNRLPTQGTAQASCLRCFGVGTYWDAPGLPFKAYISYMHLSPSPDEPGTVMDTKFGAAVVSEPSLTLPRLNPYLAFDDPMQPTKAWDEASTDDIFVAVDMLSRYTASLMVGGTQNLPYQQNVQIAPEGAVTVWNPTTRQVDTVVAYTVSGATVTIEGYPAGTGYMVEFQAAPLYVAFRRAGGLAHIRPFGGGTAAEPKRFRLQTLDFWTRERNIQQQAAGSAIAAGSAQPFVAALAKLTTG